MRFTNTPWAEGLNQLAELEKGWLDGEGETVSEQALVTMDKIFSALDSDALPAPGLSPSADEGFGIIMGWTNYTSMRYTGDFRSITCHLPNNCDQYYIGIIEHRPETGLNSHPNSYDETEWQTGSFDEAVEFLRSHLERLGFYSN